MSKRADDPWLGPVAGWVRLSHLFAAIEKDLQIAANDASKIIRRAVGENRLAAEVVGWVPSAENGDRRRWWIESIDDVLRHGFPAVLTSEGWKHVETDTGTLEGHQVLVRWSDVEQLLAGVEKSPPVAEPPVNRGGRPKAHDWEAFWIEVARYGLGETVSPEEQDQLQSHMVAWSAGHMDDPAPDPSTIRKRLLRLYNPGATSKG